MSFLNTKRSYTLKTEVKSSGLSQAIEDSKQRTSLLKDNSWIRKSVKEDEPVNQDSNFGKVVLNRFKSMENLDRRAETDKSSPTSQSGSVRALTKRFSASQSELSKSSAPSSEKFDPPKTTTTKTVIDSKTTETSPARTPVIKGSINSATFTQRVFSDAKTSTKPFMLPLKPSKASDGTDSKVKSIKGPTGVSSTTATNVEVTTETPAKGATNGTASPSITKTTKTEVTTGTVTKETTETTNPSTGKTTKTDVTTITPTKDTTNGTASPSITKTTKTEVRTGTVTKETTEPKTKTAKTEVKPTKESIDGTSFSSHTRGDDVAPRTTSISKNSEPRPEDNPADTLKPKTTSTVQSSSDKSGSITEKDICTCCHKPMNSEPKMILDDMQIHCHASCFRCEVCKGPLEHLKAGDSMWVYRRTVHCENCFGLAREKWYR